MSAARKSSSTRKTSPAKKSASKKQAEPGPLKKLFVWLRPLLGVAILAYVATTLPWQDQVSWVATDGVQTGVFGEITGDWKSETIGFAIPADASIPEGFEDDPWFKDDPGVRSTEPQLIHRWSGVAGESGYEWKPSMQRAFGGMEPAGLAQALAVFSMGMLLVVTRWWRLLAVANCATSWFNAFRLTFLGMFFNLVVPGLTGGDLVKGVMVVKENPKRRADALMSVLVDRLLGLGVLAVIGIVVILLAGDDAFAELRGPLLALILIGLVGACLYANKKLRKVLGLSALVDRLPFGEKLRSLDQAALLYLKHPLELTIAVAFSVGNHILIILGVCLLGRAFGVDAAMVSLKQFMVLVPVANIVSALPLAPGGWGLGEAVFKFLFELVGASGALGVAVSVTFRLCQLLFGLVGGIFLLLPGGKKDLASVE